MFQQPTALLLGIAVRQRCNLWPLMILYAALLSQIVYSVTQDQDLYALNASKAFCYLLLQGIHVSVRINCRNNGSFIIECKVDNCWKCAEPSSATATEST